MKKVSVKIMSVLLVLTLVFTGGAIGASATDATANAAVQVQEAAESPGGFMKFLYNALNVVCEALVSTICKIYPDPADWQKLEDYDSDEVGFMAGRENYQTEAKEGNKWSLGYSSRTIVPEDIADGKYYIGRDLTVRIAKDVYESGKCLEEYLGITSEYPD